MTIAIKTYSEFLDGRESSIETKREYVRYLQGIMREINNRIAADNLHMSHDQAEAIDAISDLLEAIARE